MQELITFTCLHVGIHRRHETQGLESISEGAIPAASLGEREDLECELLIVYE